MAGKRVSMRKIREVLRLAHDLKLSVRQVSEATGVGKTALGEYIARASAIYGFPLLAENADRVITASELEIETEIKRGVIKLIGAAGRTRKPVQ